MKSGWEVEWCTKIPVDENGESIHDDAKFEYKDFATQEEALAYAKTKLQIDQYGSVRVTPFHQEPFDNRHLGSFREYDADPIYVDE